MVITLATDIDGNQAGLLQKDTDGEKNQALALRTSRSAASSHLPVPQGFLPEGGSERCIDQETLYLLKHALPPNYQGIFAHLLFYATLSPRTSMQPSLFHATGEANNEAIVLISSVDALAKSPGSPCGPETYHKGILAMEALKIIRRKFHRGYTEIRIPLGKREIHIPSLLLALRQLHDEYNNPKVKQLARKVARRLRSGAFAGYITASATSVRPGIREILTRLLREHGVEDGKIRPIRLAEACEVISQAMLFSPDGRVPDQKEEFGVLTGKHIRSVTTQVGDSDDQLGESVDRQEATESYTFHPEVTVTGESVVQESPSTIHPGQNRCDRRSEKGNVAAIFRLESPAREQNLPLCHDLGDSNTSVSISVIPCNDIPSQENMTLIDTPAEPSPYVDSRPIEEIKRDAKEYESVFDNKSSRKWRGSLVKTVRETPPAIRHCAAVGTFLYSYFPQPDGTLVRIPGAWFTSACQRYRRPGATIPAEVRAWAETGLSLKDIEQALQQGFHHPAQATLPLEMASNVQTTTCTGEHEPPMMVEPLAHLPIVSTPCASQQHSRLRTWMNEEEAVSLRARILRAGRPYGIGAEVAPGEQDGVFVVVTTWNGVEEEMCNEAEWIRYFTETRDLV